MPVSSDKNNYVYSAGAFPDGFRDSNMDGDEIYLNPETDIDDTVFNGRGETYRTFTARQRIEIAREGKWLESTMSDFDDYTDIEGFDDDYAVEFSH